MNCAFDKEKLTGYYDGELDAAEKAEVERHIASCSECLRELGELKSAAVLVKELPRLRAPRSIAEGVSREIQTAGRVHSFARFRRNLLWAASAAAGLLVILNVVYFAGKSEKSPERSAAPALGRATPRPEAAEMRKLQQDAGKDEALSRAVPVEEQQKERGRRAEARKDVFGSAEEKKAEPQPGPDPAARDKAAATNAAPKLEEKSKAAAEPAPAPVAAKPTASKPEAPGAPPPAPAKAAEAPADRAVQKKDGDGLQAGKAEDSKLKRPAEHAAEPSPNHLTLATTQTAKSRTQLEDALRKMGALPPPPAPATMKGAARSTTREENVYSLELTDAQIARLRAELEKPGTSVLVAGRPEDPVLAQYRRGGLFEPKRESAVASGGAPAGKKAFDAAPLEGKGDSKEKDAKELNDSPAAKAEAEKANAPRRKIVLHLMEVPPLSTLPAGDPVKK